MSPDWTPGELYIAGAGLAQGYWRDEEKTAERFVWHEGLGERLYRTGDLGRYLPDGNIEFLGREDAQVKIQGFRIELGEIESALRKHPRVKEALVTVVGSPGSGAKRLAAYVVPHKIDAPHQPVPDTISHQVLTGLKEREEFKEKCLNIRPIYDTDVVIRLHFQDQLELCSEIYKHRRSYREFRREPISFERFSEFFKSLRYLNADGKPKYQYASAGGIYPVQVYLHVKPGRIENVPGGTYYYHPVTHELVYLSDGEISVNCHWPMNHEAFQSSAFSIFLIAEMAAVTPLYGKISRDFCLLEAGMMMQMLEVAGTKCEVGLCQVGSLDFDHLRPMFQLKESQVLLHSAVGGSVSSLTREIRFDMPEYHRIAPAPEQAGGNSSLAAAVDGARLREYLKQVLPAPFIPTHWIMLDALPLSANGKVDRKALPPPEDLSPAVATFVAPGNELERQIASIIADELKIDRVGVEENFFELGATSINLVRINTRLRNAEIVIPIVELFQYPTVAALSRRLAKSQGAAESPLDEEQERARKQRRARARHLQSSLTQNPSEVHQP